MRVALEQVASIEVEDINENAWLITSVTIINIIKEHTIILLIRWLAFITSSIWVVVIEEQELIITKWDYLLQAINIEDEI